MRLLLAGIIVAALAWGGYWFVGARALEAQVHSFLDRTPQARADAVRLLGFPNRFDLTLTRPQYDGPNGTRWSAPFAQLFALSYRPNHVILVLPNDQQLDIGGIPLAIHSTDMRASVVTRASTDLPLDRFSLVSDGPRLSAPNGLALQADVMRLASRADDQEATRHALGFELLELRLPPGLRALLDPDGVLPPQIARAHLDAMLQLDRPVDRHATDGMPRITGIDVASARIEWGDLRIEATGVLQADAQGHLSGDIDVTVTEWTLLLEAARRARMWEPQYDLLIVPLFRGLAEEDGDPTRLSLPLTLQAGRVYLGPIELGFVPPLPGGS